MLAEYRLAAGGRWLTAIGAPGDTFAELEASLRRSRCAVDVRPRVDRCRHDVPTDAPAGAECPECLSASSSSL